MRNKISPGTYFPVAVENFHKKNKHIVKSKHVMCHVVMEACEKVK